MLVQKRVIAHNNNVATVRFRLANDRDYELTYLQVDTLSSADRKRMILPHNLKELFAALEV
ncbi:MAG: hypothetical protein AABX38_02850 [Candidatus Micrarchaeota archaeon]